MSFLGVDLGNPAKRQLTRDLELRLARVTASDRFRAYPYRGGGAELCLRHGKFYQGRQVPDRYAHLVGGEGRCFLNAATAVREMPELVYCEGYYTTGAGSPSTHGWCVAPDGGMVELTMPTDAETLALTRNRDTGLPFVPPSRWGYYGVTFAAPLVWQHADALGLPMLDRPAAEVARGSNVHDFSEPHNFPALRVPYDPNRTELP